MDDPESVNLADSWVLENHYVDNSFLVVEDMTVADTIVNDEQDHQLDLFLFARKVENLAG